MNYSLFFDLRRILDWDGDSQLEARNMTGYGGRRLVWYRVAFHAAMKLKSGVYEARERVSRDRGSGRRRLLVCIRNRLVP